MSIGQRLRRCYLLIGCLVSLGKLNIVKMQTKVTKHIMKYGGEIVKAELIFSVVVCVLATVSAFFFAPWGGVSEIITLRLMYLGFLFASSFGVIFVLRGTRFDVLKEIFEENNMAAALLVGSIFIAVALVIRG